MAKAEALLASGKNFWRDYLAKWKFAETKPYGAVGKANPELDPARTASPKSARRRGSSRFENKI